MLLPGSLSRQNHTNSKMQPTKGINANRIYHPLLPVSCKRLKFNAKDGINIAKDHKVENIDSPISTSTINVPIEIMKLNRKKYQYSFRRARPVKVAYLEKTLEIASPNDISTGLL